MQSSFFYDEKGNHKVYMSGCKDSKKDKLVLRHNADGTVARDPETHEPIYDPVDEVDEHGNKIVIGTTEYGRRKLYKHVQEPDNMQLANYNYSKYLNKNRTHSIVMSSRFNVTDKWHLLTGLQFTHFSTLQSKDMLVYDGKPASTFQTQSSLAQDHEHYTARAKGRKFTPYFPGMDYCRSLGKQNRFAPNKSHAPDRITHTHESSSDPHQTQAQPTAHSQYETPTAPIHTQN